MEQKTFEEFANAELAKLSIYDKMVAVGTISGDYSLFDENRPMSKEECIMMDTLLIKHIATNGPHGVQMAVKVGRATIQSLKYPIKPAKGPIQYFKNKVKEWLA